MVFIWLPIVKKTKEFEMIFYSMKQSNCNTFPKDEQAPQCVRNWNSEELYMSCQHLQFCNTKSDSTYPHRMTGRCLFILQDKPRYAMVQNERL